jgi:hypothetical protein
MKILTHPAMLALGLAVFCLLTVIAPLVSPTHAAFYHLHGSAKLIVLPILLNLAVLWLLLTLLLMIAERPGRLRIIIWSTITLGLPFALLKSYSTLIHPRTPHTLTLAVFALTVTALLLLWLLWKPSFLPMFERVHRLMATALAFATISGILVLVQLLWFTWQARNLNLPRPLHHHVVASVDPPRTRVIWLILDELSYQQVYERRFPGLNLPALDELAAHSTLFTHTMAVADSTEIVIPSLITGTQFNRISASAAGQPVLRNVATGQWQVFDPHQTVFQDALDKGYSTAIAGWFNPYCRILAPVVDRCFWASHFFHIGQGLYADQSFTKNLFVPANRLWHEALSLVPGHSHGDPDEIVTAQYHIDDYQDLRAQADDLIADSSVDFLYLHLPVPHPEGIYDRRTGQLSTSSDASYIDNLALADKYVAHIHNVLIQRGEWDSSAFVLMGDHSWRTRLVRPEQERWTREDEAASDGGKFEDRPVYLVKLPNQREPVRIDDRFGAVRTRALLNALMANGLKTPEDLAAWVRQKN